MGYLCGEWSTKPLIYNSPHRTPSRAHPGHKGRAPGPLGMGGGTQEPPQGAWHAAMTKSWRPNLSLSLSLYIYICILYIYQI